MQRSFSLLPKAISIAVKAHRGQKDRYGKAYILHPLRVMSKVAGDEAKTVAILHDVVEDTAWTLGKLKREGFPEKILRALDCLTRKNGEDYEKFVERSSRDVLARRVKLADLEDNMDLRRLDQLKQQDIERFNKYINAYRKLQLLE